jgi:2OG-Fe(II) oxygenase superfamily
VVGVSLLAPCTFRFRRKSGDRWDRQSVTIEPRSAYMLSGPSREVWEHSVPPFDQHRYSITFRTLASGISSGYGLDLGPGPRNYFQLVIRSARMEGFIVLNYLSRFGEGVAALQRWMEAGELAWRVDVDEGLENAPATLAGLFAGKNFGKQLLKVAEPPIT